MRWRLKNRLIAHMVPALSAFNECVQSAAPDTHVAWVRAPLSRRRRLNSSRQRALHRRPGPYVMHREMARLEQNDR